MKKSAVIQLKPLIISIIIPLAVGGLSGFLTSGSMKQYQAFTQPPLSPPAIAFPIVWLILFLLMGISAYLVYQTNSPMKKRALIVYAIQLFFNFMWSIFFFRFQMWLFAFLWLIVLWLLVVMMKFLFYHVKPVAAYLQIPYLLWISFAAYLNYAIYVLNK